LRHTDPDAASRQMVQIGFRFGETTDEPASAE
jgi:hypothetical protein